MIVSFIVTITFVHSGPVGRTDHDSLRIVSAKQQYMYSEDGVRYLDMRNNVHHGMSFAHRLQSFVIVHFLTCIVGHSHPRVVEACVNQMKLLNTNSRFLHDDMLKLAKRLSNKCCGLTSCIFVNSGYVYALCFVFVPCVPFLLLSTLNRSEANDLALQIAERVTGGTEIISLQGYLLIYFDKHRFESRSLYSAYHGHLKSLRAISSHAFSDTNDKKPDYAHFVSMLQCIIIVNFLSLNV